MHLGMLQCLLRSQRRLLLSHNSSSKNHSNHSSHSSNSNSHKNLSNNSLLPSLRFLLPLPPQRRHQRALLVLPLSPLSVLSLSPLRQVLRQLLEREALGRPPSLPPQRRAWPLPHLPLLLRQQPPLL